MKTTLEHYTSVMEGCEEHDPIERLRFFLSLALTGQDWIDVEQFIDGVSQQLAEREKQIVMLRYAVEALFHNKAGDDTDEIAQEALDATQELSGCILCDAEPFLYVRRSPSPGYHIVPSHDHEAISLHKKKELGK
jgi:hypothetical protein